MFLSKEQINKIGFKSVGNNVLISDKASIYNAENISIGNDVRIDDFCILSAGKGGIEIGNNIHISCYVSLIGAGKITLEDYSGLSMRVSVLSSTDDFSGLWLTNPMCNEELRNVISKPVIIGKNVVIGAGCVIMPGVTIKENSTIGALSLVKKDIKENEVHAGIPAKFIKERI